MLSKILKRKFYVELEFISIYMYLLKINSYSLIVHISICVRNDIGSKSKSIIAQFIFLT